LRLLPLTPEGYAARYAELVGDDGDIRARVEGDFLGVAPANVEVVPVEGGGGLRDGLLDELVPGLLAKFVKEMCIRDSAKLAAKGADAIVVNQVGDGVGIEADTNAATFLTATTSIELPEMPKRQLADRILDEIVALRRPRSLVVEMDEDPQTRQARVLSEAIAPARRQLIVE